MTLWYLIFDWSIYWFCQCKLMSNSFKRAAGSFVVKSDTDPLMVQQKIASVNTKQLLFQKPVFYWTMILGPVVTICFGSFLNRIVRFIKKTYSLKCLWFFDHCSPSISHQQAVFVYPDSTLRKRYASALGQSLRPWKMPRNWPIRQGPELNYKEFSSLGCILVKALDLDAQQQQPKPTTNNLNQQPEVQQHIISPKNPRADPLPLFCNRRVKIPLDIVLMACACCPTQRIRGSRLVTWKHHMDGKRGIGSSKLLAFSLSSFKLTFLWCACMVVYLFEEGWRSCICIRVKNDGSIYPIHLRTFYFRFDLGEQKGVSKNGYTPKSSIKK